MDVDPRLNEEGAERALRGLFQKAGHLSAPEGMEARVLNRLAVLTKAVRPTSALLPKWAWLALLMALLISFCISMGTTSNSAEPQLSSILLDRMSAPALHSKWVFMGTLCLTALVSLHAAMLRGIRSGG